MERDLLDIVAEQWTRERPAMQTESIGVIGRILRIAKFVTDERRRLLHDLSLDSATFDLLATLRRAGAPYRLSPAELSRQSLLSGGAVTQRVARAEAAGLVRAQRTDSGRRTVAVELSSAGHEVIERNIEILIRRERALITALTSEEQRDLADLLRRLLAGLETTVA
jgi:DNA-binding MarR family transcriptional regulator